jgi:hypothetical protein
MIGGYCRGQPQGSHKQPGETRLKPTKNAKRELTHEPKTHAQRDCDPGGPLRPTKATQQSTPSGEVRLARGPDAPSGEARLARGLPRGRRPRSCSRMRAFNAPTQGPRHYSDTPGNHTPVLFHRLPRGIHPRYCVTLCGEASVSPVTLCRLLLYD